MVGLSGRGDRPVGYLLAGLAAGLDIRAARRVGCGRGRLARGGGLGRVHPGGVLRAGLVIRTARRVGRR